MCEVFRPIDEELTRLNQPVVAIVEDDIDSALDGFRVTNSGSVMVPSGSTKPLMVQRSLTTMSSGSLHSAGSSSAVPTAAGGVDPYYQTTANGAGGSYQYQYQNPTMQGGGSWTRYSTSVPMMHPTPPPTLPGSLPRSLPRSVPKSLPPPYYPSYPQHAAMVPGGQQQPMTMVGSPMVMSGSPAVGGAPSMAYPYPQYYPGYGY